jgi:hypothetical protein
MTTAMAQPEVIASSQLSSSIIENEKTSTNPNNDNESSDAVTASAPTTTITTTIAKNNLHGSTGNSGVSFGSVHVHQHRMTLGANPEVRYGVPVELAWEVERSCVFDTVDEFEETVHAVTTDETSLLKNQNSSADPTSRTTSSSTVPHPVKRMTAAEREEIASVHHSRDSIVRVQSDMHTIQQHRHDSQRDPAAKMVVMKLEQQPHAVVMPIGSSSSRSSSNQAGPHVPRSKRWMLLCCGCCCTNQQLQQ